MAVDSFSRWFVLSLNPEPWAVGPVGYSRRGGRMSAYVGRNQQLDAYKEAVREEIGAQSMIQGKIALRFYFWRQRAEYTTPQARAHRKHEADLTNLQKATEDALQGILFQNDRDVVSVKSFMVEQGPEVVPRIIISVEEHSGLLDPSEIPENVWSLIDEQPELPFDQLVDPYTDSESLF